MIHMMPAEFDVAGKRKLTHLEGLRGICAFMVLISHFMLGFYPGMFSGGTGPFHARHLEQIYWQTPLIILGNGRFYVCVFFVLSGYVLSRKFFAEPGTDDLYSAAIRRFPRLYLPVAVSLLLGYILLRFSLMHNLEVSEISHSQWLRDQVAQPRVLKFLGALIYSTMFRGNSEFNSPVWTINLELYGSFLVFGALALFRKRKFHEFLYCLLFIVLTFEQQYFYSAFVLGILLNVTDRYAFRTLLHKKGIVLLLLIAAIYLGGFPILGLQTDHSLEGTVYSWVDCAFIQKRVVMFNVAGAFLLILAIQQSETLQRFFSLRPFAFLGRISYSLYLLHALMLQSFMSWLFLKLFPSLGYNPAFIASFIPSVAILLICSWCMTKYIDDKSVVLSGYIYKRYFV